MTWAFLTILLFLFSVPGSAQEADVLKDESFGVPEDPAEQPMGESNEEPEMEEPKPKLKKPVKKEFVPKKKFEFFAGSGLMVPEVIPFEFNLAIKRTVMFRVYIAPPTVRMQMPVAVPEYNVNSTFFKIYSPAQTLNADITYGPHFGSEAYYFPGKGRFYFGGGFGVRQITAEMDDNLEFYICQANDANCGSSPNPAGVHISGSATSTTILGRSALGWLFRPTKRFYVNLIGLGISVPLQSSLDQNLNVELVDTNLPPWLSSIISVSVNNSLDPYEASIAEALYDAYGKQYDSIPFPMAGVTMGFMF